MFYVAPFIKLLLNPPRFICPYSSIISIHLPIYPSGLIIDIAILVNPNENRNVVN